MGIESNQSTAEFDDFVASGEVEVRKPEGDEGATEKEEKPKPRAPKPAPAAKEPAGDDDGEEGDDQAGEEEGDEEENDKPKKSAKDHQIERLKREKRDLMRQLREGGVNSELSRRLENIEKGLSGAGGGDTKAAGKPAPDPSDSDKYPLGHLDDRYIEDKLRWLAQEEATKLADSALQRQQEIERTEAASRLQADVLEKVEEISAKGSDLYPDFQEEVVETGMRGDWKLDKATFEACHKAENGAQILYELSQNPDDAAWLASQPPSRQRSYVQERDTEIGTGKKGRTKPKAGDPPKNTARGANSRTTINPATDDLGDFEKAWEQDAKRNS